jgi:Fe-S cluster assembly iron-binding protein IscA
MKYLLLIASSLLVHTHAQTQTCSEIRVAWQNTGCCGTSCSETIPNCSDANNGVVCFDGTNVIVKGLNEAMAFENTHIVLKKSIIPDTHNAYDLGNAEYKIRDIYEDMN